MNTSAFFTRPRNVFALALLCCLLWGSSYPAIKSGYALFGIAAGDLPAKLLFAGWRFLAAGLMLLAFSKAMGRPVGVAGGAQWARLGLLGLTQTTLQYVFFYVGLAYTTGVKGSILNATGTFFSVMLAHWLHANDRLTPRKVLGCMLGFAGVMVVNVGRGALDFEFTLLGEGFIVIAAFVLAASSIYGRRVSQGMDPVVMTGWQLTLGGAALLGLGWGFGGSLHGFTPASTTLLGYLALLSAAAFSLWSLLLKHNRVSLVTAFNFMVPVFGTALSAIFLGERVLEWKNALALVLVCAGIWLVTQQAAARRAPVPAGGPA
ncbi:DMT family transporter [Aquincola sp. MAHUQ-54]|uniref:DMT family transporter n=1 Tax=Aquincola agrisoli TaxID=3119538 RepID=A0AAW9Q581_9BURK